MTFELDLYNEQERIARQDDERAEAAEDSAPTCRNCLWFHNGLQICTKRREVWTHDSGSLTVFATRHADDPVCPKFDECPF